MWYICASITQSGDHIMDDGHRVFLRLWPTCRGKPLTASLTATRETIASGPFAVPTNIVPWHLLNSTGDVICGTLLSASGHTERNSIISEYPMACQEQHSQNRSTDQKTANQNWMKRYLRSMHPLSRYVSPCFHRLPFETQNPISGCILCLICKATSRVLSRSPTPSSMMSKF